MWLNETLADPSAAPWEASFFGIDSAAARARIAEHVRVTPLEPLPSPEGLEILGKMENAQVTGSFKARGALNNVALLTADERARGVVASSSGNHGRALAWAAGRAGVAATIVMPEYSYPNKIEACRAEGADVILTPTRADADRVAGELASPEGGGKTWVHPYDRPGTIEGAGTVGVEIAEQAPEVDAVVLCVGGGGLSAGSALALRRALGGRVAILGAEPVGANKMTRGLGAGEPVHLDEVTSRIQGINTLFAGQHNITVNAAALDAVVPLEDEVILEAQRVLVRDEEDCGWRGQVVEPAGAAAYALARDIGFAPLVRSILARRGHGVPPDRALRVVVTVSGGNPDPAQLEAQRA